MNKAELMTSLIADSIKKEILEWAREPCKDRKEKCHECVNELLKRFEKSTASTDSQEVKNG